MNYNLSPIHTLYILLLISLLIIIVYKIYTKSQDQIENFESVLSKLSSSSSKKGKKSKKSKSETFDNIMKRGEDLKKKKDRIPDFMTTFNNYKKSFNKEKFKNNIKNMGESLKKFSLYKEKLFEIFK
jgi:hypothetical protein